MTEDEARAWVAAEFDVPRETMERLDSFVALLRTENERQNLVSRASLDQVWLRHVADSAQLLRFAPSRACRWIDLGTGAGFPGLVVAALHGGPVTLAEERRLRVDFLERAAQLLGIDHRVTILSGKVERQASKPHDVISARAFAPMARLLELGSIFSTDKSIWILPKGRNARSELEAAESSWQGEFRLEPSMTDPEAHIVLARGLVRKAGRKRSR